MTRKNVPEKRTDKALLAVAYHEAGHAVAGWRLGIGLRRKGVTIVPKAEEYLGCTNSRVGVGRDIEYDASDRNRIRAEKKVQSLLAGVIAQRRYNPRMVRGDPASNDRHATIDILSCFTYDDKELGAWMKLLRIRTERLLSNPDMWRAVERLAETLMERRTIPGKEATAIIMAGYNERLYAEHPELQEWSKEFAARLKAYKPERRKLKG